MNSDLKTSTVRFAMSRKVLSTHTATIEGEKFVDFAHGGSSFLGFTRADSNTRTQFMMGFIYNFHVAYGYAQIYSIELWKQFRLMLHRRRVWLEIILSCFDDDCQSGLDCLADKNNQEPEKSSEFSPNLNRVSLWNFDKSFVMSAEEDEYVNGMQKNFEVPGY